jgi:pilus assembly protein Flp/PilA
MLTKLFVKASVALEAKKQQGVTAIEYAIIGVAISAVVLAVFSTDGTFKSTLTGALSAINTNISAAK